jgi:hypothetical protein
VIVSPSTKEEQATRALTLSTYLTIGLVTAFFGWIFLLSPLSAWDTPGHVFASAYFEQHLWPWFSGWNSLSFGGYPQGYFYPSLLHWLAGGLGKVIGVTASLKLLIVFSLAIFPFSLNAFLKSLSIQREDRLLALLWIFIVLTAAPMSFGGTFQGLIVGGLLSHQFAMPFYFFYLSCLKDGANNSGKLLTASALLGLIILSHAFVAVAAVLGSLVYLFIFYRNKKLAIRFCVHVLIALALSLCWIVPYFLFREFQGGKYVDQYQPLWFLIATAVTIAGLVVAKIKGVEPVKTISYLLLGLVLPLWLSSAILPRFHWDLPLHIHRLWIFLMIYGVILLCFATKWLRQSKRILGLSIVICIGVIVYVYGAGGLQKSARVFLPRPFFDNQPGLIAVPRNSDAFADANARHLLTHSLMLQGAHLLNGLFIESALNGPAINSTLIEVMGKPYLWGVFPYGSNEELLPEHLKYLGVCWVGSFHPEMIDLSMKTAGASKPFVISIPVQMDHQSRKQDLWVYSIPCSRGEAIPSIEFVPDAQWQTHVEQWWTQKSAISRVLVSNPGRFSVDASAVSFEPNAPVRVEELSFERFRISVDSATDQFVYLKIPYFPNWHAYQDGREIALMRAAPNQMVIKAKGIVDLQFKRSFVELGSYVVSLLSWLLVLASLLVRLYSAKTAPICS